MSGLGTVPATPAAAVAGHPPRRRRAFDIAWPIIASLGAFVGTWALIVEVTGLPPFILPGPFTVVERFVKAWADGTMWPHVAQTLVEILLTWRLKLDHRLGQEVVATFASGEVLGLRGEGEVPEQIAEIIDQDQPDDAERGLVVFFTGLSGSGKSTIARALHDLIAEDGRRTVTSLDGDVVRRHLSEGLTFSKEDRETNIRRIGWVAAEISRHRGVAICSPIAPFDATRQEVRRMVAEAGGEFVLVHVATSLAECERRDRKGLYAKARAGEIPEFTGISSPYEEPADATIRVDTEGRSIEAVLGEILAALPIQLLAQEG